MGIFSFFKKSPEQDSDDENMILPEYNMYLEILKMVHGKEFKNLFYGNTSVVPNNKRKQIKKFIKKSINDEWLYVTEGKESIELSFQKNEFVKILKENGLSTSGNKKNLIDRIESNLGLDIIYKLGNVSDWIKLTSLGKSKVEEYKAEFEKKYNTFKQFIYQLFLEKEISEACSNIDKFKDSYPFDKKNFFISLSGKELYDTCVNIRKSDFLTKINVPNIFHDKILATMCLYYSFGDFDYKDKIKEFYNDLENKLIKSKFVKNKEYPFIDFQNLIRFKRT